MERFYDADSLESLFAELKIAKEDLTNAKYWFEKELANTVKRIFRTLIDEHDIMVEKWTVVNALMMCGEFREMIQSTAYEEVNKLVNYPALAESIVESVKENLNAKEEDVNDEESSPNQTETEYSSEEDSSEEEEEEWRGPKIAKNLAKSISGDGVLHKIMTTLLQRPMLKEEKEEFQKA